MERGSVFECLFLTFTHGSARLPLDQVAGKRNSGSVGGKKREETSSWKLLSVHSSAQLRRGHVRVKKKNEFPRNVCFRARATLSKKWFITLPWNTLTSRCLRVDAILESVNKLWRGALGQCGDEMHSLAVDSAGHHSSCRLWAKGLDQRSLRWPPDDLPRIWPAAVQMPGAQISISLLK